MGMIQFRLYAVCCILESHSLQSKLVPIIATDFDNAICLKFAYGKDVEEVKENLIEQGYLKRLEKKENCKYCKNGKLQLISVDVAFTEKIVDFINWQ